MALRSLAAKMRIPVAAASAARLPSAPRVSPPSASRALPFSSSSSSSSSSSIKSARDWYLIQRARYDDVAKELTYFRRELVWTERLAKLFDGMYILNVSLCSAPSVIKVAVMRKMRGGNSRRLLRVFYC